MSYVVDKLTTEMEHLRSWLVLATYSTDKPLVLIDFFRYSPHCSIKTKK